MIVDYAEDENVTIEDLGNEDKEQIDWDDNDMDFD